MANVNLNPGGLIGGLAGLGVAGAILYARGMAGGRSGKLVIGCVTGGAIAGNYLWGLIFPAREDKPVEAADPSAEAGVAQG